MEMIELSDGVQIYYRKSGTGRPLLLQHGWGGSSLYWQSTIAHISDIRTVYAIDLPGYGQSPPMTTGTVTPKRLADLLIEFLDAVGADEFDLVGHSLGANLVAHVAGRYTERVQKLVLTCPATYRNGGERRMIRLVHGMLGMTLRLRRTWFGRIPPVYRRMSGRFFHRLPEDETLLLEGFKDFLRMDRRTGAESALNAVKDPINDILQNITTPTLIVAATEDQILPQHGPSTVAQLIPNSRLVWIENCGHLPMVERPDVYHWILREFLVKGKPQTRVTEIPGGQDVVTGTRIINNNNNQTSLERTMPRLTRTRRQELSMSTEQKSPAKPEIGETTLQQALAEARQAASEAANAAQTAQQAADAASKAATKAVQAAEAIQQATGTKQQQRQPTTSQQRNR